VAGHDFEHTPERFADLDPMQTLRTLYARFQPVPLSGVYWVSLK